MNEVEEIIQKVSDLGLRLACDGEQIVVFSVDGRSRTVPPDLIEQLRKAKPELLQYLARHPYPGWGACPPNDLPLRSAPLRLPPEQRRLLIGFVVCQSQAIPSVEGWFLERCEIYYSGPAKSWDCGEIWLAACADLACWQLGRDLQQAVDALEAFEEAHTKSPNS